jgi:cellulose biosynthesis protein BcsQ
MSINFNDTLRIAAQAAQAAQPLQDEHVTTLEERWLEADSQKKIEPPTDSTIRIIRDVYGRLRFGVNCDANQFNKEAKNKLNAALTTLQGFATKTEVLFRDDLANPDLIFNSTDWHLTTVATGFDEAGQAKPEITIAVMDRQIMGQDWLNPISEPKPHPPRIVFYGLKGGVGRSTALAMAAYGLARAGKRVLLLDFDLESPGLSGLLLPPARVADFGLVDWFVEDAVGQGETLLPRMVADSPLAESTRGAIRVAAAMGQTESDYLSKLSRVYADVPGLPGQDARTGLRRFATRMQNIVELLEAQENPDVVLIDSRAGLHDVAAISITSLADTALLFATDSAQNWLGYRQLFSHWQHRPEVCKQVRERLRIVQALAPKSDREGRSKAFRERSYDLFTATLYDEIAPHMEDSDIFSPSSSNMEAPHFPIRIDWDDVFQEFNPLLAPENGGVSPVEIDAKFGALITWVVASLDNGKEEPK